MSTGRSGALGRFWRRCSAAMRRRLEIAAPSPIDGAESSPIPVSVVASGATTSVDRYWSGFTVYAPRFESAQASLDFLEWRFDQYPLFREFMDLYGHHEGQTVLDFGCGPGNDVVGFLVHGKAAKVIGIDISAQALALAARRVALHGIGADRLELIRSSDSTPVLPLPDASVDHIYCEGVLHHVSDPQAILGEFHRVLRPGGAACIMVYNRASVWLHLHTAYIKMVLEGAYAGLSLEEAFARTTDTETCPIARPYSARDFSQTAVRAGFESEFVGGYLSRYELEVLEKHGEAASRDERLAPEHRHFIRTLTYDARHYPMHDGKYAGIGGVYRLRRAA